MPNIALYYNHEVPNIALNTIYRKENTELVQNLEIEMTRNKITKKELAEVIGMPTRTFFDKLSGKSKFTTEEAFKIRDAFFPDLTLDYLFEQE